MMEKDICKSISRGIALAYARERMHEAQKLFGLFRLCDCSELGRCLYCVQQLGENSQGAFNAFGRHNLRESSTQTEDSSDSSGLKYCSQLDREDAATSGASSAVPRPLLGVNRNIYTQAQQGLLSEDDFYDGIRNPYVLVINNVNFIKPSPWPRNGASHDRDNIRSFVKEAGFKTVVERFDLSKENMLHVFEQTRRNGALVEHDSFICIIMSHGNEDGILGIDGEAIRVDKITAKFQGSKCPQMATKPKLFFIQACRGNIDDDGYLVPRGPGHVYSDSIEEMPVKLPSDADFLIAYSTTKGYLSHRRFTDDARLAKTEGKTLGSWFISCLVQVFQKYSHKEDLMTMLTRVNNSLCQLYTVKNCKQISCQLSMLTKKVYFAKYFDQESSAV